MLRPSTRMGKPGVGHGAHRLGGELHHPLDGFERGLGAHRAVEADRVHRPGVHLAREGFGIGAAGQVAEIVDGDLGDDGQIGAGGLARGADRLAQFVQIAESFEDQQVDAGFHQRFDLLAEDARGLRRTKWGRAARCARPAARRRRPRRRCPPRRLARQPHAGAVDGRAASRPFRTPPGACRLAPKVLVSRISAPALTYSWWIWRTRSGEERFSSSKQRLMKTPREYSMVPMAPSATRTRRDNWSRNSWARWLAEVVMGNVARAGSGPEVAIFAILPRTAVGPQGRGGAKPGCLRIRCPFKPKFLRVP